MTADEKIRWFYPEYVKNVRGILSRVTPDVGHEHVHPFALEPQEFRILQADVLGVNIPIHPPQGFCFPELCSHFLAPEISRMPYFIAVFKNPRNFGVKVSMGV